MRLRVMESISRNRRRRQRRRRARRTRGKAGPQDLKRSFDSRKQRFVAVEGPDEQRAKDSLAEYVSDLGRGKVVANFPPVLAELDHLGVQLVNAFLQIDHALADGRGRQISLKKRADDGWVAHRFLRHAGAQTAKELRHRLVVAPRSLNGGFELSKLHLAEGQENMIFAWEVIEESPFADVRCFGDVLHGSFCKPFLSKELQGRAGSRGSRSGQIPVVRIEIEPGAMKSRSGTR